MMQVSMRLSAVVVHQGRIVFPSAFGRGGRVPYGTCHCRFVVGYHSFRSQRGVKRRGGGFPPLFVMRPFQPPVSLPILHRPESSLESQGLAFHSVDILRRTVPKS